MKSILQSPWTLASSLTLIFVSGFLLGRLSVPAVPQTPPQQTTITPTSDDPEVWASRAADRLSNDLKLDSAARIAVRNQLFPVAHEIFDDLERANFQMYLRLLAAHDQLASFVPLDKPQQQRLSESRNRLKSLIIQKFPRMVHGHPNLALEPHSPR